MCWQTSCVSMAVRLVMFRGTWKWQIEALAVFEGTVALENMCLVLTNSIGCIIGFRLPTCFLRTPVKFPFGSLLKLFGRMLGIVLLI